LEQALASSSPVCPFCKGAVAIDVLRFGGNCPHCMLEIPGEEAPTDPGLQARQRQEQEQAAARLKQQKKSRVLGIVAGVAVLALCGVGFAAWRSYQESITYDVGEYYELEIETIAAAPPDAPGPEASPPAPENRPADNRTTNGGRKTTTTAAQPGSASDPVAQTFESGSRRSTASGPGGDATLAPSTGLPGGAGGSGLGGGKISVSQVGGGEALSDPQQIFEMAKRVISGSSPQLQACYTQRLKQVADLKGAWELSFTITKDGGTTGARARGLDAPDSEFEACMVRSVGTWRFQRITKDFPVKKTYRFGASSW
jgi:hypothetical protein